MEQSVTTRLGDGSLVRMTPSEIRADLEEATALGAKKAKVPPLEPDELERLLEIFASNAKFTAVDVGDELVLSCDGSGNMDSGTRVDELYSYQSHRGADIIELYHIDYSYKAVKTVLSFEQQVMKNAQLNLTAPLQYGAMPDLGRYSQPDGPVPNWSELMPLGRIDEARAAQEEALEHAVRDMVFVAEAMIEAGADGLDFDTAGAAGDADFLAALRAVEEIKSRHPDVGIELGMASEFVLGMHGELEFHGRRLAGLWPRDQVKVAAEAGVTMFGPAVNVNTTKSVAWNVARALTIVKPCVRESAIPVHMNVGMGVGGVPMTPYPPADAVSRVSRALREVGRLDGLQVGVGDPLGMACSHALASGMGGMRTAGDLVARMQMTRGMRLEQAKAHVAERLGVSPFELSDPLVMHEVRRALGLGLIPVQELTYPSEPGAIEAKFHIAEILDVPINSVQKFREHIGPRAAARPAGVSTPAAEVPA